MNNLNPPFRVDSRAILAPERFLELNRIPTKRLQPQNTWVPLND